jgi:hypothetical protein
MSTETHEEYPRHLPCSWPEKFTKRRQFNRPTENVPYIEFLRTPKFPGEDDEANVSSEDEDDEGDEVSSEHGDEEGPPEEKLQDEDDHRNEDRDSESSGGYSDVRLFMTGLIGDEEALQYNDQVEEVASFCEQTSIGELERKTGQYRKRVALLDDRNICGTALDCQCTGHCRPYQGPLTSQQLAKELRKKVARIQFFLWAL